MVSDGALVKCMQQIPGKNSFRWPNKDEIVVYDTNSILSRITKTITPTNNRGNYKMHADDNDLANEMMKHNIEKQRHTFNSDFNHCQ